MIRASRILLMMSIGYAGCAGHETPKLGQTEGRPIGEPLVARPVSAPSAMVATDAPLATEAGVRMLQAGGNAIDAVVAVAFAAAVVYPEAGNVGGGGFAVARFADGTVATLDFREVAPLKATRDMYLDEKGDVTGESLTGHRASGVPGAVAGLWALHQRHGSKPWAEVLAPAIAYAEDGFVIDDEVSRKLGNDVERLSRFEGSRRLFLRDGKALPAGTHFRNPEFAAVLRRIAERGPDGFYKGETADLIVAEMQRGGGLISHEDLARYEAKWRRPIEIAYRGHRVISMAPASSGGITLGIMANILNGYDLKSLGPHSSERYHLIAEASRRAFADRNYFLGDPDRVAIPFELLLSEQYARDQRKTISTERATASTMLKPGLGQLHEGEHTTHYSVVDAHGNAVGLTTTLNELHGSAVTVSGAGFLLNDEMDDFTAKPGVPNLFGLVQGVANAIAPGKRMLSAMTPTIVVAPNGSTLMVTGARGGPRIISAVFQVISNVVDHGMGAADAVVAPRIHHQHLPDTLFFEKDRLHDATVAALEAKGHQVRPRGFVATAPTILRVGDMWVGVPDPRSGGLAKGY